LQNEDKFLKIGNIGSSQSNCIDSIPEVDLYEKDNNESFLYENNNLFDVFEDISGEKFNISIGSTLEETNVNKFRKANFLQFKCYRTRKN